MKRLWKIVKAIGANLPFLLAIGLAFWAGFYLDDKESMHFWIIMAAFFMVLRELFEIRGTLKRWEEVELPEEPENTGRHHVRDSMHGSNGEEAQREG